jgi:hypothetical protein
MLSCDFCGDCSRVFSETTVQVISDMAVQRILTVVSLVGIMFFLARQS